MLGFDSVLAAEGQKTAADREVMRAVAGFDPDPAGDPAPGAAGGPAWLQDLVRGDIEMRRIREQRRNERRQ
jgi:hypothetical protein